ncbi:hypothetical protein BKA61DRAFT_56426 [Leptodontidium sp. MPI-SDFR-AT-0119]|nr:hypothetical protein BKA61DRAFT_56426 [Leptodontidium sp. MPI-SDFR-AT-0119]
MAEALGVAASISGLITIADIVVRRGYAFIKDVKDAGENVEKLVLEVNLLFGILHSLKIVVEQLEQDASNLDPTMQIHWIEPCYQTLLKIQTHLQKAMAGESMTSTEKMKWPLRKSATKELLGEIERHKLTITVALSMREMSALCQIRDGMYTIKAALDSDQAERKKIFIDDKRQKMLQVLGSIEARNWQDSNIRLRQLGTGIWFTEGPEFMEWLSQERSKLWINGIPGAGKTILMSSTIQKIEAELQPTEALAFFYCDYKDSTTHNASTILGSLAKQLIMRHEDCFEDLTAFYDDHVCSDQSIRTPLPEELCQLINKVSAHFDTVMIVVDGLDEILNGRAEISRLLATLNSASGSIKTILSSRPEVDIGHALADYRTISIAAQSSDIRLYIASEIEQRIHDERLEINEQSLKEHIMITLAERCDGMFRWVACQMDYLCECSTDKDRREALTKLPPDLPSSYERILERVNRSTRENQRLVKNTLQWIVYARRPLSTEQLLQALAIREGDTSFDSNGMTTEKRLRHWCSSLVRKKHLSDCLELAHFTVEEFLLGIDPLGNPALIQYHLSGDQSVLAMTCMGLLRCETFNGDAVLSFRSMNGYILWYQDEADLADEFLAKYPFFRYAATEWFHHVHKSNANEVDEVVLQLFNSQKDPVFRRMTASWHYCSSREGKELVDIIRDADEPSLLHWAACFALYRVCTKLLKRGADVDKQSTFGTPLMCCVSSTFAADKGLHSEGEFDFYLEAEEFKKWNGFARQATVKAILDGGACTNTPIINGSPSALDVAAHLDYAIYDYEFFTTIRLLRAGARVLENAIKVITGKWYDGSAFGDTWVFARSEVLQAIIEAAIQSDWLSWMPQTLAHFFGFVFSSFLIPTEDHIDRLSIAFEKGFPEATATELKSLLHTKSGGFFFQVACSVLKAYEYSCETSESFRRIIWEVLAELLRHQLSSQFVLMLPLCSRLDLDIQDEDTGQSLLHMYLEYYDISYEDIEIIEVLRKASIFIQDCNGISPVDVAYSYWDLDMNKLLWRSANPAHLNESSYEQVNRTLYSAFSKEDAEMIDFLMKEVIAGQQPVYLSFFAFVLRQDSIKTLNLILEDSAKVHGLCDIVMSSLHLATDSQITVEVFEALLVSGKIEHRQDAHGNTPFHFLASMHDDSSTAKLQLLIESGRSFDDLNSESWTPLGIAVRCKNLRATKIFLDAGIDVDIPLSRGQTVLQLAICLGNTEAVDMLRENNSHRVLTDDFRLAPEQLTLGLGNENVPFQRLECTQGEAEVMRDLSGGSPSLYDLRDSHGKLPLRLGYQDAEFASSLEISSKVTTCASPRSIAGQGSSSQKPNYQSALFESTPVEDTMEICGSSSSASDVVDVPVDGNRGRITSKRQFQSLDCILFEPSGKRPRQV